MKTGLVLEGGAMRGMYTAGVLDVMIENDIRVDGVIGVSAGAVFGCNYKSGQIGRSIRYNEKYCRDPRYCSVRSLLFTGDLYNEKFCYHDIPETLDPFDNDAFIKNPTPFWVVCTDVNTGEPVYHLCTDCGAEDLQWMRASASMPLASRVVKAGGYELLDGGVSDSIPLAWFRAQGYERNIVILTRPEGYRKEPTSALPLMKLALHRYPKLVERMANRHNDYNAAVELVESDKSGNTLLLRPSRAPGVKRVERDPAKLRALYNLGREDALARLEEIRTFVLN
ncbi:MAG: patatin family protein [Clostridia bacterium]|nr:patatin family protein [Clostridia bacterium]